MSQSTAQLLHDCEAITDDGISYAALALFGKRESLGIAVVRFKHYFVNFDLKSVFIVRETQVLRNGW